MKAFWSNFALPLVAGGPLQVSRPIWPKTFAKMVAQPPHQFGASSILAAIMKHRWAIGRRLWPGFGPPAVDETTARLAVATHNLLSLGHPSMQTASARVRDSVIGFSLELAKLGPPPTATAALERHTMLSRMGELERDEHDLHSWLGTRSFVGGPPPKRLTFWPKLRKVQVTHQKRNWLRELGVPNDARPLWEALGEANPLMEALDPSRLDPPVSWDHLFAVLRFPLLARAVSAHLVEQGLAVVAEPLVVALFVHAAAKEGSRPTATSDAVVFGIAFLAHMFWLHVTTGAPGEPGPALAALLAAASDEPCLVLPADVRAAPTSAGLTEPFLTRVYALRLALRENSTFASEAHATVAQAKKNSQFAVKLFDQ